jgi:DNA (cytosine-5)-methyltransferase 1
LPPKCIIENWDPQKWNLIKDLPLEKLTDAKSKKSVALNETENEWIEAWNEFVVLMREKLGDKSLPGFPIWADEWVLEKNLKIPVDF